MFAVRPPAKNVPPFGTIDTVAVVGDVNATKTLPALGPGTGGTAPVHETHVPPVYVCSGALKTCGFVPASGPVAMYHCGVPSGAYEKTTSTRTPCATLIE